MLTIFIDCDKTLGVKIFMSSDKPIDENLEAFQDQVSEVGKLMLEGVLEKLLGQTASHEIALQFLEPFMAAGSNSVKVTATLAALMLNGHEVNKNKSPFIQQILTHHVFEVVFDTLDKGIIATPEERDRLITLNEIACKIIQNPDYEYSKDNNFISIKEYLDSNVSNYILTEGFEVPVSRALETSFATLADLSKLANDFPDQEFAKSFKDSMIARYRAVSLIASGAYSNIDSLEAALELRQKAILIETTMKSFIMQLASDDPGLMLYIQSNKEDLIHVIGQSARLVGVWNDFGSGFTHDANNIVLFFELISNVKISSDSIREMVKSLAGEVQTTDVTKLLEGITDEGIKIKMRKYLQILKDSVNDEPNLALDLAMKVTTKNPSSIFFELHSRVVSLLENVTRFYCDENVPIEIRNIVYKAMLFHYHIYSELDYYNQNTSGLAEIIAKLIDN